MSQRSYTFPRSMRAFARPAVLLLFPVALFCACTTAARPIHAEPSGPPTVIGDGTSGRELGSPVAPIQPDRPDVTNGTSIVDVGLLQVEAGAQHARLGTSQRNVGTPLSL